MYGAFESVLLFPFKIMIFDAKAMGMLRLLIRNKKDGLVSMGVLGGLGGFRGLGWLCVIYA